CSWKSAGKQIILTRTRASADAGEQRERRATVPRMNVSVPGIPQPLAFYTPAARAGNLVFAAGQPASDFKHGVAPEARLDPAFPYYGSAIKKQTRYVLENLAQTFKAAGTSLDHVVKAQVFHTDLMNFSAFHEGWKEFFPTSPTPAPTRRPAPRPAQPACSCLARWPRSI